MRAGATAPPFDPAAFVARHVRPERHALVPELLLDVAPWDAATLDAIDAARGAYGLAEPFWAFAWSAGQALARFVLDHPAEVAGHVVLDFGTGCGVVALAAARAGAARVVAADIDPCAVALARRNAEGNGLAVEAVHADPVVAGRFAADVILGADIFYFPEIAARLEPWFRRQADEGVSVLLSDVRRNHFPDARLELLDGYEVSIGTYDGGRELEYPGVYRMARTGIVR